MKKTGRKEDKERDQCFKRWLEILGKKPTRLWEVRLAFMHGWHLGKRCGIRLERDGDLEE